MKVDIITRYEPTPDWLRYSALVAFILSVVLNVVFGNFGLGALGKFGLFVTPPGYVFTLGWTLIYLLVLVALTYAVAYDIWPPRAYWASIATSVLNALWVALWTAGSKNAAAAALFVALGLLTAVLVWWHSLSSPGNSTNIYYAMRNVLAFYLGWTLIITVLNFGVVLVHALGVAQTQFVTIFWVLTILGALLVYGAIYWAERMHGVYSSWAFWLAIAWGLFGALLATIKSREGRF